MKKKPLHLIFCKVLDFLLNRHQKNTFWEAIIWNRNNYNERHSTGYRYVTESFLMYN